MSEDIKEKAERLRDEFSKAKLRRVNLAHRVSDLFDKWKKELEPLTDLMAEYKIPYGNACIEGESRRGFVIGESVCGDGNALYIFDGHFITEEDADSDAFSDELIDVTTFILEYNSKIEHIQAGFDFVRYLETSALKHYNERNNELIALLKDNGVKVNI